VLQQKIRGELPGLSRTACLVALVPVPPDALLDSEELPLMVSVCASVAPRADRAPPAQGMNASS